MLDLGPQQERLHGLVRDFAREEVAPIAAALNAEHRFGYELILKLGRLSVMGAPYPDAGARQG